MSTSTRSLYLKLAGASVVIIPLSIYGGVVIKEYMLSRDLGRLSSSGVSVDRVTGARIVELAQERQRIMKERDQIDSKILLLEKRLAYEQTTGL